MKETKKCPNCNKEVTARRATYCTHTCSVEFQTNQRIKKYNLNPKYCKECDKIIPYEKKANKFCNSSCSASYSNTGRVHSEESKIKQSNSLKNKPLRKISCLLYNGVCVNCHKSFLLKKGRICCSIKCSRQLSGKASAAKVQKRLYYSIY